jgi:hypothetical protein
VLRSDFVFFDRLPKRSKHSGRLLWIERQVLGAEQRRLIDLHNSNAGLTQCFDLTLFFRGVNGLTDDLRDGHLMRELNEAFNASAPRLVELTASLSELLANARGRLRPKSRPVGAAPQKPPRCVAHVGWIGLSQNERQKLAALRACMIQRGIVVQTKVLSKPIKGGCHARAFGDGLSGDLAGRFGLSGCGFGIAAASIGAVLNLSPIPFPFLSPAKWALTDHAHFFREIGFLDASHRLGSSEIQCQLVGVRGFAASCSCTRQA